MSKLLENKVALITGGASGIGLETAKVMLREGAKVMITDINQEAGDKAVNELSSLGDISFCINNVADAESCQKVVAETVSQFGKLDIAVNNAGIIGSTKTVFECDLETWQRTQDINVNGVFYGMRAQFQAMKDTGGVIVNLTSIAGKVGVPSSIDYVTSKHAVEGLTKAAALDLAPFGIRVNSVGPGVTETPMVAGVQAVSGGGKESMDKAITMHPIGRLGQPSEIAEMIAFISSDKASWCTGSYYPVNGGYLAH